MSCFPKGSYAEDTQIRSSIYPIMCKKSVKIILEKQIKDRLPKQKRKTCVHGLIHNHERGHTLYESDYRFLVQDASWFRRGIKAIHIGTYRSSLKRDAVCYLLSNAWNKVL